MDYESGGAADATTPGRLGLVPAAEGQARRGPPSGKDDLEAFAQAISLQAAARAARFAKGSSEIAGSGGGALHAIGIERENREIKLGKRGLTMSPNSSLTKSTQSVQLVLTGNRSHGNGTGMANVQPVARKVRRPSVPCQDSARWAAQPSKPDIL
jgi:hypothetical protein